MKKRRMFAIGVALAICSVMVSCGGTENESVRTKGTSEVVETVESRVTLTMGYNESSLPIGDIVQQQALAFEELTGIHIAFEEVPDAQWRDILKTRLSEGNAPDIFVVDCDPFSLYDRIRPDINCVDLSDEEFVSRMDKSVLPAVSYEGKVYGITFSGPKIWIYAYRKDIFEAYGLEIPTTYEELKAVSAVLEENGHIPMWQVPSTGWHQVLPLFESGPLYETQVENLYDRLNKNAYSVQDIQGLRTILEQINEFSELGYYGDDYFGNTMEEKEAAFVSGEVVMTLDFIGWPIYMMEKYPELDGKVGIFLMPWADNQILGINPVSNGYFANAASPYQEEILSFFRYLAQPAQLQLRLDEDPEALEVCWPEIEPNYTEEYLDYLNQFERGIVMQASVSYIDAQWMDVGEDIEKMFAGLMTPEEVLEQIQIRRDKMAIMAGDPYWQ